MHENAAMPENAATPEHVVPENAAAPEPSATAPAPPVFEAAAVPERLPTMHDLDQLAIELDTIDRTLAQLDQPVAPSAS